MGLTREGSKELSELSKGNFIAYNNFHLAVVEIVVWIICLLLLLEKVKNLGFLHTRLSRELFGICSQSLDLFDQLTEGGGTVHGGDQDYLKILVSQDFRIKFWLKTLRNSPNIRILRLLWYLPFCPFVFLSFCLFVFLSFCLFVSDRGKELA